MKIFAIGDLHLSLANPKPMDRFGDIWRDHYKKIKANWLYAVHESDIVLIPGDISWAPKYIDALPDIRFLADLPGRKVIIKGNHDYWWPSIKKLEGHASERLYFLQNNIVEIDGVAISGIRLWNYPFIKWRNCLMGFKYDIVKATEQSDKDKLLDHEKIRNRETERLKLCLANLQNSDAATRIFMTHFPPIGRDLQPNPISRLLSEANIEICVFGHLHSVERQLSLDSRIDGVRYFLASSDYLDFRPKLVLEF